jgi:hypothetical protein
MIGGASERSGIDLILGLEIEFDLDVVGITKENLPTAIIRHLINAIRANRKRLPWQHEPSGQRRCRRRPAGNRALGDDLVHSHDQGPGDGRAAARSSPGSAQRTSGLGWDGAGRSIGARPSLRQGRQALSRHPHQQDLGRRGRGALPRRAMLLAIEGRIGRRRIVRSSGVARLPSPFKFARVLANLGAALLTTSGSRAAAPGKTLFKAWNIEDWWR